MGEAVCSIGGPEGVWLILAVLMKNMASPARGALRSRPRTQKESHFRVTITCLVRVTVTVAPRAHSWARSMIPFFFPLLLHADLQWTVEDCGSFSGPRAEPTGALPPEPSLRLITFLISSLLSTFLGNESKTVGMKLPGLNQLDFWMFAISSAIGPTVKFKRVTNSIGNTL